MFRKIVLPVVAVAASRLLLRRAVLDWGSTPDEATRRLPGDELLVDPDIVATRAVTIEAPPSAVWPWLVQMGIGRGGMYTYDWIENLLGLDIHSVDRIVPEWQNLAAGDRIPAPDGRTGRIAVLEPEHALVYEVAEGEWVWAFVLEPLESGGTRLLSRNRFRTRRLRDRIGNALIEPGSLVMERKMLHGIKQRAERLAREQRQPATNGREPIPA